MQQRATILSGSRSLAGTPLLPARPSAARCVARCRRAVAVTAQAKAAPSMTADTRLIVRDEYMENTRKDMRHVFDPDRWEVHRSTNRYLRHMTALPTSRLLRGLGKPLAYVASLSVAVGLYETAKVTGELPIMFPDLTINTKELFGLTSFALALLLVFRTNAAYERWDGARKMWGLVLNRSRDIVRQGLVWIPKERPELRAMLCRWVPAFSKSLMCHLRKGEDLREELTPILLPHEVDAVLKSTHRPNYCLQVLGQIIGEAQMPTPPTLVMDINLTAFEDCLGGCERILRTPIPVSYTRHTSRFLMIWLTLLPFTLWPSCGWGTPFLSSLIGFLLLGVEKIGVSIEEPFSILALEAISNTALVNVRELKAMHDAEVASNEAEMGSALDMVLLSMMAAQQQQHEAQQVKANS